MNKTPVVIGSSLSAVSSSLAAVATSLCCVGPAVFAVLGTSGTLAAARLAPYRTYFIACSVLLLGFGFWMAYRRQGGRLGKTCTTSTAKVTRFVLWLAAFVTVAAIFLPNFVRR